MSVEAPAAPEIEQAPPSRWRRIMARALAGARELFPTSGTGPSRAAVLWGILGALAAGGIALARTGGAGALNTVWIEDAHFFLSEALAKPFTENLARPMNGYFHTGPRIIAEIASVVPLRWSAAVLALLAVAMQVAFAATAYVASGPFLSRWWLRLLVAAPVVAVPLGHTQADNDIATLQFPALYAMFWVLLWRPQTRAGKVAAVLLALYIASSSILPIVFIPLLVLRLALTRDWVSRAIAIAYGAGVALQLGGLATGASTRGFGNPNYNPAWVLGQYVGRAVPRALLGEKWFGGPGIGPAWGTGIPLTIGRGTQLALIGVCGLLLLGVVVAAVKLTRPHWPLAIAAGTMSFLIFAEEVANMGTTHPRYVIPAALLLYVAIVALLRPDVALTGAASARADASARITANAGITMFAVLLIVVCAVNLRGPNSRSQSQAWDVTLSKATAACASGQLGTYEYKYTWWSVFIPCDRTRL